MGFLGAGRLEQDEADLHALSSTVETLAKVQPSLVQQVHPQRPSSVKPEKPALLHRLHH